MHYEELIESVELGNPTPEALEQAAEAMAFLHALHTMFVDNGAQLGDNPNPEVLHSLIDSVHGELAAACIFLSEKSFARVPEILRGVAKQFKDKDVLFTDPDGVTAPSVPEVVRLGFSRLADRIEATRVQQQRLVAARDAYVGG